MSLIALVLLVAAVALVATAEWSRLQERLGLESRQRQKRKDQFRVVEGMGESKPDSRPAPPEAADDFAASVQRDLENLPVIDPHDKRF